MPADDFNLDTWLDAYEPVVTEARVVQKAAFIAEHTRLQRALMEAQAAAADVMHDPAVAANSDALRACEDEIAASEKVFTFQSKGHAAWQSLKRQHPASPADKEAGVDVAMETFAPAAIAAFSLSPPITREQAEAMRNRLPPGEFAKLYGAVLEANGEVIGPPKSVLAALTERLRQNVASLTTDANGESPVDDYSGTLADPSPE